MIQSNCAGLLIFIPKKTYGFAQDWLVSTDSQFHRPAAFPSLRRWNAIAIGDWKRPMHHSGLPMAVVRISWCMASFPLTAIAGVWHARIRPDSHKAEISLLQHFWTFCYPPLVWHGRYEQYKHQLTSDSYICGVCWCYWSWVLSNTTCCIRAARRFETIKWMGFIACKKLVFFNLHGCCQMRYLQLLSIWLALLPAIEVNKKQVGQWHELVW